MEGLTKLTLGKCDCCGHPARLAPVGAVVEVTPGPAITPVTPGRVVFDCPRCGWPGDLPEELRLKVQARGLSTAEAVQR